MEDPLSDLSGISLVDEGKEFLYLNSQLPLFLQQSVTDFLRDLKRPKYSKPLSYEEICILFRQFYVDFEYKARESVVGSVNLARIEMKDLNVEDDGNNDKEMEDDELVKKYVEIAEFKVTSALCDKLMVKSEANCQMNEFIKRKIELINSIRDLNYYELLDLSPDLIDIDLNLFIKISKEFNVIQNFKSPLQKLVKLVNIHYELINTLRNEINGDYILPIFIYLILINDNKTDLYLNLTYIKNFRNPKFFQSDELYCLTNIEAALTYVQNLDLKQYSFKEPLTNEQELIINSSNDLIIAETPERYTNQPLNFVTSAFDSSFKTVFNRFKQDSTALSNDSLNSADYSSINPLKNFMGDVMKWTKSPANSIPSPEPITGRNRSGSGSSFINKLKNVGSSRQSVIVEENDLKVVDLSKFKGREFEDMKINELKEMFKDYQILANHVKS